MMALLIFCAFLLSAASLSTGRVSDSTAKLTCAGNFTLRELACYSYSGSSVRRSFHHAQRHCSRLRASLSSLLSPAEESFVMQQLVDNETAFWIGLTDRPSTNTREGRFRWSDGTALSSHAHWQPGEPSSASHLRCVQVDSDGWALARGGCSSTKLPFVCKKRACPEGLEWSGSECDVIAPSPSPLCHPLLVLLLLIVLLAAVCHHHYRTSPTVHGRTSHHKLHHSHNNSSPLNIQDLIT